MRNIEILIFKKFLKAICIVDDRVILLCISSGYTVYPPISICDHELSQSNRKEYTDTIQNTNKKSRAYKTIKTIKHNQWESTIHASQSLQPSGRFHTQLNPLALWQNDSFRAFQKARRSEPI